MTNGQRTRLVRARRLAAELQAAGAEKGAAMEQARLMQKGTAIKPKAVKRGSTTAKKRRAR